MISIIICSRSATLLQAISKNISETVGVPYELIEVNNANNQYSICSAYNHGANQAKYNYLCFVHEDVLFRTHKWGNRFISHFINDSSIGLIGVAGSIYKSKMSTAWWQSEPGWSEIRRMNLIQHNKQPGIEPKVLYVNPLNEKRSAVVALDGVLMCCTKDVWQNNHFDEVLLKGFHGYDLDYCLQVFQSKKVVVVYDILIDHFSGGVSDGRWLTELIKVHKKWKAILPLHTLGLPHDIDAVYTNSMKRLRKNMNVLLKEKHSLLFTYKVYHQLFSFLDHKPSGIVRAKEYLKELGKIIKMKYSEA